jgi:hypothetical protein
MKIIDIANEIYIDAGSPDDTSLPAIAFWIRGALGTINNLLFEDFIFETVSQEITKSNGSDLPIEAIAIFKQSYRLYDYSVQFRKQLNALASDSIVKFEDQGTMVMKINRNMVAQSIRQVRKDEIEIFNNLVTAYRLRVSTPNQVAGDDTMGGNFNDHLTSYPSSLRR